jgi:hypothetical protein
VSARPHRTEPPLTTSAARQVARRWVLAGLVALAAPPARAQTAPAGEGSAEQKAAERKPDDHDFSFVVVPGPVYNPSLGWGLMVIPMAMYDVDPSDEVSPGSTTAAFGMATTNGSWAGGAFQKVYLARDTWRLAGGLGAASINQRFYGIGADTSGTFVDMTMDAPFAVVEGLRRVVPSGYAGLQVTYRQSRFRGKDAAADEVLAAAGVNREWDRNLLPGLRFDYDTRDVQTAPRGGLLGKLTVRGASESLGSTNSYARVDASYSQYHAFDARNVLAWNASVDAGFGDVPFDEYPDLGANKALRGYVVGQFTDKNMVVVQAEWRWGYWRRLGAVAFGGVGKVFPSWDGFGDAEWLPSGGVGARFLAIPERRMNARFDVAWGREGANFYFSVGEAF